MERGLGQLRVEGIPFIQHQFFPGGNSAFLILRALCWASYFINFRRTVIFFGEIRSAA